MGKIEVIKSGLYTSIQDQGRFGFANIGVPQSGVLDSFSVQMANLLLGNHENDAVLEITMTGPHLRFNAPTAICISGAKFKCLLNKHEIENNKQILIKAGDEIKFIGLKQGFRAYLAIAGGFKSELVMGSRSQYNGITSSSKLQNETLIFEDLDEKKQNTRSKIQVKNDWLFDEEVETFKGPEYESLSPLQKKFIANTAFEILPSSNRMAIGFKQKIGGGVADIITSPVLPGTVQLTPAGDMIVLMKDCQVTGGYARILQISEKGMCVLAQKKPGEKIVLALRDY